MVPIGQVLRKTDEIQPGHQEAHQVEFHIGAWDSAWGGGGPRIRNRGGVFGLYLPVKRTPGKGLLLIIPVPSLDVHVCSRAVCLSK